MNVAVTDAKLMLLDLIAKRVNTALHQSISIRFFDILITCWKMRNGMFCYSQIINYILIRTLKPAINGFNIFSVFYLRMYTPKTEIQNKMYGSICFFWRYSVFDVTFPHWTCKEETNRFFLYKIFLSKWIIASITNKYNLKIIK